MPVNVIERLKDAVDIAKVRIDLDYAQNPELRRAIHVVEVFLQKSGRVCYGGQAINAHLDQKDQFYNPEQSLPDYDFFTPDAEKDTEELIQHLRDSGYSEISKRIGIHDGTIKIYVNYTAIADISQMIPEFYDMIYKKSKVVDGIHYADTLFLRMLMYLELSRPRGQVERWEKVYGRLKLLDKAHALPKCKTQYPRIEENIEARNTKHLIIKFILENNRVFSGADIYKLYKKTTNKKRVHSLIDTSAPTVFFSPNAMTDANILSEITQSTQNEVLGYQNILPAMIILLKGNSPVCVIVQEEACHSIITLPLTKGRHIRVASLETMLTFLIGLYYREDSILMTQDSLLCWIRQYIDLSDRYKSHPTKVFPAFPLECSGYQTTFASLLRAKAVRIQAARQKLSSGRRSITHRFVNHGSRRTIKHRFKPYIKRRSRKAYY